MKREINSDKMNIAAIDIGSNAARILIKSVEREMGEAIKEITSGFDDIQIIGSGGNINRLYRLAPKREKRKEVLMVSTLQNLHEQLDTLSVEERMKEYDLRSDRADVIVPAAKLFLMVADIIKSDSIIVPNVGLADGLINELAAKYQYDM